MKSCEACDHPPHPARMCGAEMERYDPEWGDITYSCGCEAPGCCAVCDSAPSDSTAGRPMTAPRPRSMPGYHREPCWKCGEFTRLWPAPRLGRPG